MKKVILLFLAFVSMSSLYSQNVQITDRLQRKMQSLNPIEYTRVLIILKDRVDIVSLDAELYRINAPLDYRALTVINTLKEKALQTQGPLMELLNSKKKEGTVKELINFWVDNIIYAEATADVLNELTRHSEIEMLDLDEKIFFDKPVTDEYVSADNNTESAETGLKVIKADLLWNLGITGAGRTVMNIDTGVHGLHPALGPRWWGNNGRLWYHSWFDPVAPITTIPTDCTTHGTHTMGIMCGRNTASGDTVGVAPDARWMAAGITDCPGYSNPSMNIAAYQWAIDPDSNSATMDMPDVISCAWQDLNVGGVGQCTSIYVATLNAVEAAGIAVVFSAGNSGPGASSITPPKNIGTDSVNVFCVGAVDGNTAGTPIASFSSRGPSICGGTGTLLIKPEVSAPGVDVRSSIPNTGYDIYSGTSMAAPHVAGCIALLKQAAPGLTGKQLKTILFCTCTDLGTAGEDNTYGKGLINVYAAYQQILSNNDTVTLAPQGLYNTVTGRLNMRDTVRVYLRSIVSPYVIVDSGKTVIDSVTLSGTLTFNSAPSGTYYVVAKRRSDLETWSKAGGESFVQGTGFKYNFTTAQSQAYGNNLILVGTKYCNYTGDVDQNYAINLTDIIATHNDDVLFVLGYVNTDLNGDGVVNLSDVIILSNNASNFVTRKAPPGAAPGPTITSKMIDREK